MPAKLSHDDGIVERRGEERHYEWRLWLESPAVTDLFDRGAQ
jgi:hypothetical protein